MSTPRPPFNDDFNALCYARDELALQLSLMKAEMKQRWQELEHKMEQLREHMGRFGVAAGDSATQIDAATKGLIDALRNGYAEMRNALRG